MSNTVLDQPIKSITPDVSRTLANILNMSRATDILGNDVEDYIESTVRKVALAGRMSESDRLKFKKIEAQLLKRVNASKV